MTILVVDDSPTIRSMVGFCLKRLGHTGVDAVDGQDALAKLAAGKFDMVITDLNMPNLNGKDLIAKLQADARWQHVPVIMVSTDAERAQSTGAGANAYLTKPFKPQDLLAAITQVTAHPVGR